tara:strand:+ start:1874 stop:1993 length:120 start_codon:yes stop_codon:yes gene_type:complete
LLFFYFKGFLITIHDLCGKMIAFGVKKYLIERFFINKAG